MGEGSPVAGTWSPLPIHFTLGWRLGVDIDVGRVEVGLALDGVLAGVAGFNHLAEERGDFLVGESVIAERLDDFGNRLAVGCVEDTEDVALDAVVGNLLSGGFLVAGSRLSGASGELVDLAVEEGDEFGIGFDGVECESAGVEFFLGGCLDGGRRSGHSDISFQK